MPSVRKTKTASGATAVQVVQYRDRKVVVLKHIGSARTSEEIGALLQSADAWIERNTGQTSILNQQTGRTLPLTHCTFSGVRHTIAYRTLMDVATRCGFDALHDPLALDFAIIRAFEPCSKRRSRILLERYFGIQYSERTMYRTLCTVARHKEHAEQLAVACARKEFSFDCSLVLYDVTTLYFESFREDEDDAALRKTGFSKDNKPQQPQIVVGLLITSDGFPLGYALFKGNTFEGHTMIPVIDAFRKKHDVKTCTIVADAAMLSLENIGELRRKNLSYIVGARVANLSPKLQIQMSEELCGREGATARFQTKHGDLLCSFSQKRFEKDKRDMKKQIARAEKLIASGEQGRRAKFVRTKDANYVLNEKLIAKTEKLLGIKGYVTNIPREVMGDQEIIAHYRNLWHVEQAFRMTKSDLKARPMFHHLEESIRAHLLICFLALTMSKFMEIKTGLSLQRIIELLRSTGEAIVKDEASGQEFTIPSVMLSDARHLLRQLGVSY
jgi:transposase